MRVTDKNLQHSDWKVAQKKTLVWGQRCINLVDNSCHSPNSEPCPSSIWLFWHQNTAVYLHQNTTSILVFYNGLISIKIPMVICPYLYQNSTTFTMGLFPFKLCSCLDLFSLSINPQTPHNLRLLYRVFFYLNSFSYFMYLRLVVAVTSHSDHICSSSWITPSALSTLSNFFQYRSHTSSLPQVSLLDSC